MSDEWREGYDAHLDGLAITTNPYDRGTIAHDDWRCGWLTSKDEDNPNG